MEKSTLAKTALVTVAMVAALTFSVMGITYSTGPGSCTYPSTGSMGQSQPGTGGFVIEVTKDGDPVTAYAPGSTYTVTLSAPTDYTGFLLQSVAGDPGVPNENGAGEFMNLGAQYQNGPCAVEASSVGHSLARRNAAVASDSFEWVAPEAGTGPVTFHAVGVYSRFDWHGQETLIVTTLSEGDVVDTGTESWSTVKSRYD